MHTLSHSPPPDSDLFPPSPISAGIPSSHVRMNSSRNYYEDVDPRFTDPTPPPQSVTSLPRSLTPGGGKSGHAHGPPFQPSNFHPPLPGRLEPSASYETTQNGAPSPTSDVSNFSPVSQRGVDPNWRTPLPGGTSGMGAGSIPNRRPVQQQQQQQQQQQPTNILQPNSDFESPQSARR